MSTTATIPRMPKQQPASEKTTAISTRMLESEAAELDRIAAEQTVAVDRATLVRHIIREWLKAHQQPKSRSRQ